MNYFHAKTFGTEAVQNFDFMSRPGIFWRWGSPLFNGEHFGTNLSAVNCYLKGGLHDFAHCIDFIMRGRSSRVTRNGLVFKKHWEKLMPAFNIYDGDPLTSQMIHTEARAIAYQAFFMKKELGFIVDGAESDDLHRAEREGLLAHMPINDHADDLWPKREYFVLTKMSIEEYAEAHRSLSSFDFRDSWVFLREHGHNPEKMSCAVRKNAWEEAFKALIIAEYARMHYPFREKRISRSITELGERLRRFHKATGFRPGSEHIGLRSATKQQPAGNLSSLLDY